jgi:multidrug efflux pump subunit AcrB
MAGRIVTPFERALTTTVNDIEHIEANSYTTFGIVKIFFHPSVNIATANAQVTAISQTLLKQLPPGATPPLILNYSASTVPIIQLALSGKGLTEQSLADLGLNFVRTRLVTVQGAGIPFPFGGKSPQVMFDLDTAALQSRGLTGLDVANALAAQNLLTPAGTEKIGDYEYTVNLNSAPSKIRDLGDLPIKSVRGTMIYMHDVAQVHNGSAVQTNIVHVDGNRSVLLSVFKNGTTSTLDIVSGIKHMLEVIKPSLPDALDVKPIGDQSVFVRASIQGVIREGVIAAALTSLMILLFLGSWRSTLIVTTSIPLSILGAIGALSAIGETLNIMTLGGLALAVGILVDDATVTIENINYHLEEGKEVEDAILTGAHEIATPALVSTLAICIVFVPMFMLGGVARYLFVPLAEAVVFAMLASYLLSRTLVPTLAKYWLQKHDPNKHETATGLFQRLQHGFERWFTRFRAGYHSLLERALGAGMRFAVPFLAAMALTAVLAFPLGRFMPGLGQDFFPAVDAGQIKLHVRAFTGARIDEAATLCDRIEATIREVIPAKEIATIVDNIGVPYSGINTAYSNSAPVGSGDADILVNLKEKHRPTIDYVHKLRPRLNELYASATFAFLPADIVSQILNFGLPAPLDIQVAGFNVDANRAYANDLLARLHKIPGVVDLRIQQAFDYPTLNVDVDRSKAALLGLTETDVANDLLTSLSGSGQTLLSFWIDPKTGTQYPVVAQTPQFRLSSLTDLTTTPVTGPNAPTAQMLANLANFRRTMTPAVVSHYDAVPVIDIYGSADGADLGYVSQQINKIVAGTKHSLARGSKVMVRGQIKTMNDSFVGLLVGLAGAIILVYLLIVVNFQSWLDPFIIITALPAALAGIVWMLFMTHTPVSVPALTGAIMCMGVATANSVLVISFARDRMTAGDDATHAALQAGTQRFRPVLMTALAMIIGMVPMALGLGDGGEQNAPLGRAVIGGLVFATIATLFFVPTVFSMIHSRRSESNVRPAH